MTTTDPSSAKPQVALTRDLGVGAITMIGVGAMIGAGIFALTAFAAGEAGPGLLLAFFLNGCIALIIGGCYAELGSCFPAAGGGYLWVKQGMNDLFGFLAGWMSWFAQSLACALYALVFGSFAVELLALWGLNLAQYCQVESGLGCPMVHWTQIAMGVAMAMGFTYINFRGSSETGLIGNVVTSIKILILLLLAGFGIASIFGNSGSSITTIIDSSFTPFLPYGIWGVFIAMGLTFIAFEGFEIITQSGEEVKNPARSIPMAIGLSIAIAVTIYLLTAFVVMAGIKSPDSSIPVYAYLGQLGELGMVEVAAQIFPRGGRFILLLAGLASTTSALNATLYGSSRVSFAMGRDGNLPPIFGKINPRTFTPYLAVLMSGLLVVVMSVVLPIEDVAASTSIMFLLLFMMVCYSVVSLRQRRPDLKRSFRLPGVPYTPWLGIGICCLLALSLVSLSLLAWGTAIVWMLVGLTVYLVFNVPHRTKWEVDPNRILSESRASLRLEAATEGLRTVLVPVKDRYMASSLGMLGTIFARQRSLELFALHVAKLPGMELALPQDYLDMIDRDLTQNAVRHAKSLGLPHRELTLVGRNVGQSINAIAQRYHSEVILFGWPGAQVGGKHAFGSVIDLIGSNPPCDIVVAHFNSRWQRPRRIVIPSRGQGANLRMTFEVTRLIVDYYEGMDAEKAANGEEDLPSPVQVRTIYAVTSQEDEENVPIVRQNSLDLAAAAGVETTFTVTEADDVEDGILAASRNADLLMLGASDEGFFTQHFRGTIPERVMRKSSANVIMNRKYQGQVSNILRQFMQEPISLEDPPTMSSGTVEGSSEEKTIGG